MIEVTDETFDDEVLKYDGSVVVDFWAEWCGPCHRLSPILESLEKEFPLIKFVKVNVDENPFLSNHYNILSLPTVSVFLGGSIVVEHVGVQPVATYRATLEAL